METSEVLKFIWGRINNPHSMCPDVEIGYVRRVLGEAMTKELKDHDGLGSEIELFILGQLLVTPRPFSSLEDDWYESNHVYVQHPQPPDDNYEDETYKKAIEDLFAAEDKERCQRCQEVKDVLEKLADRQLVLEKKVDGHNFSRYEIDLPKFRMLVEMGNIP